MQQGGHLADGHIGRINEETGAMLSARLATSLVRQLPRAAPKVSLNVLFCARNIERVFYCFLNANFIMVTGTNPQGCSRLTSGLKKDT